MVLAGNILFSNEIFWFSLKLIKLTKAQPKLSICKFYIVSRFSFSENEFRSVKFSNTHLLNLFVAHMRMRTLIFLFFIIALHFDGEFLSKNTEKSRSGIDNFFEKRTAHETWHIIRRAPLLKIHGNFTLKLPQSFSEDHTHKHLP